MAEDIVNIDMDYLRSLAFYPYNLTITHNHQFPVLFFVFQSGVYGQAKSCINLFLHLFDFNLAHGL